MIVQTTHELFRDEISTSRVLTRVGLLVVEELDESEVSRTDTSTQARPHPTFELAAKG